MKKLAKGSFRESSVLLASLSDPAAGGKGDVLRLLPLNRVNRAYKNSESRVYLLLGVLNVEMLFQYFYSSFKFSEKENNI